MATAVKKPQIDSTMKVADIVNMYPGAADIMAEYGLHCYSCDIGGVESLEEGVAMHGFDADMLGALVQDLNESLAEHTERPATVTITDAAQLQLKTIVSQVKTATPYLTITHSEPEGLQLEFIAKPHKNDIAITYKKAGVTVCLTPESITQIGGATIDYANEVFTFTDFDTGCCGGGEDKCGCK